MQEVFEKIIEKLEESQERYDDVAFMEMSNNGHTLDFEYANGKKDAMNESIEIVKQEAEQYTSTEHINCSSDISTNGWIPCSERLPEANQMVLATEKDSVILCCYEFIEGHGYCFYGSNGNVIAWQPLPLPYQQKGE